MLTLRAVRRGRRAPRRARAGPYGSRETALQLVDAGADRATAARGRASGRCWAAVLAVVALLILLPLARPGGAVVRRSGRLRARLLPGARPPRRAAARSWSPPIEAIGNSLSYAAGRHRHRPASSAASPPPRSTARGAGPARPRLRRAADAAAGHVGGDRRLRLPHRPRRAAARPALVLDPRPARAGAGRRALRRPDHAAGAAGRRRTGCARRRPCWAPRRCGPGARWTCRWCAGRCWSRPGFAFAVSLGEFGATVFIARPDTPTLPVAVARLLGRAGELNYGQAMALSTILMVVCAVRPAGCSSASAPTARGSSDDVAADWTGVTVRLRRAGARSTRSTWRSPSTRSCACSAPAAAASRRCCGSSPGCSAPTPGGCCSAGRDQAGVPAAPARGRADVPGPPALPAARRRRQRRLRAADARRGAGARRAARVAELLELVGLPGAQRRRRRRAVRRRAAAGRAGPRARAASRGC